MKYFRLLFFLLFALVCIVFGFQFSRWKWLRALSGNTFKDNQFPYEKAISQRKITSKILFAATFFQSFLPFIFSFFNEQEFLEEKHFKSSEQ